jgi:rod shape-determining protein MreD
MLALDLIDRRTVWRGYWMEWVLAAVLIAINEWFEWQIAGLMGASVPFSRVLPPLVISIFLFPLVAWFVARLDQWRLGR